MRTPIRHDERRTCANDVEVMGLEPTTSTLRTQVRLPMASAGFHLGSSARCLRPSSGLLSVPQPRFCCQSVARTDPARRGGRAVIALPMCRYVRGPLPGMPYSVRCYGVSWTGITSVTRMAGCLPSVMPAGGELGETGTLDFSGGGRCSR